MTGASSRGCQQLLVALLAFAPSHCVNDALAHEGPPFPVFMDKLAGEHQVSVWADPDIGAAEFFILIEDHSGRSVRSVPSVSLWAEPLNRRLPRQTVAAEPQPLRGRTQLVASPTFDPADHWEIGIVVGSHELVTRVQSTPPGYGKWDLLIYFFPFVLIGGLWAKMLLSRRH
jgi:hypothetical protein